METRTETCTYEKVIAKCQICGKEGTPGQVERHERGHTCTHTKWVCDIGYDFVRRRCSDCGHCEEKRLIGLTYQVIWELLEGDVSPLGMLKTQCKHQDYYRNYLLQKLASGWSEADPKLALSRAECALKGLLS